MEHVRRGWQEVGDPVEAKKTVVIIENPDRATTLAIGDIANVKLWRTADLP
ncbi:hypothetical protein ACQR2B_31025 [Bradyrhizobium oligotrophicum]|uniref:hypothetical protein n=1 Tax=Bradyrhizobium TaxID=374 RepID=UPI003EBCCE37